MKKKIAGQSVGKSGETVVPSYLYLAMEARAVRAERKVADAALAFRKVRTAVADYIRSEGCSCCRGDDHDEHKAVLGKLLGVPKYEDGSGYDFSKFRSVK